MARTAAATLTGLLFVIITLNTRMSKPQSPDENTIESIKTYLAGCSEADSPPQCYPYRMPLAPLTDSSTLVAKGGTALWFASLGSRALSSDWKVRSGNGSFPLPLSFVVSAACMPSDGR